MIPKLFAISYSTEFSMVVFVGVFSFLFFLSYWEVCFWSFGFFVFPRKKTIIPWMYLRHSIFRMIVFTWKCACKLSPGPLKPAWRKAWEKRQGAGETGDGEEREWGGVEMRRLWQALGTTASKTKTIREISAEGNLCMERIPSSNTGAHDARVSVFCSNHISDPLQLCGCQGWVAQAAVEPPIC